MERDQMEDGSGFSRCIIDEIHSWDIQRYQMEEEGGVTRSIIDERLSADMVK